MFIYVLGLKKRSKPVSIDWIPPVILYQFLSKRGIQYLSLIFLYCPIRADYAIPVRDSYGRQQWGIFRNGRKPDGTMPRGGRRPTGRELLFPEKKQ
ncbi:hypothetical protein V6N11_056009 [Hibiscus sabdariffa]|uniref:Uncharacterized protein n=1 Tax=Hibiscus sabdariffa TaxID=183260 RepID=A0ABR2T3E4_9ROSI